MKQDFDRGWKAAMTEIVSGLKEWRLGHPRASLMELEREAARRMSGLTAQMVQDMALASDATEARGETEAGRVCPQCGGPLQSRGKRTRQLTGAHDQSIELRRSYLECPACGTGFFPPG